MATAVIAPNTARVALVPIETPVATLRIVVEVADDLGFIDTRYVWHGNDPDEAQRTLAVIRKTLGAVRGLRIEEN